MEAIKSDKRSKQVLLVILILMLAILGFLLWYLKGMNSGAVFNPIEPGRVAPYVEKNKSGESGNPGLGGEIYGKTSNPVKDNLPGTTVPSNPLEGAYNNPFE